MPTMLMGGHRSQVEYEMTGDWSCAKSAVAYLLYKYTGLQLSFATLPKDLGSPTSSVSLKMARVCITVIFSSFF